MITASPETCQPVTVRWQHEMARAITSPEILIEAAGLDPALIAPARAAASKFGLRVATWLLREMESAPAKVTLPPQFVAK